MPYRVSCLPSNQTPTLLSFLPTKQLLMGFVPNKLLWGSNGSLLILALNQRLRLFLKHKYNISLCNHVYKILFKFLECRLKRFLSNLVSKAQSVFMEGRSIIEIVVIAILTHPFHETKYQR